MKITQRHVIQGVLKVLSNVLTAYFPLLDCCALALYLSGPHTSAQRVPTYSQSPSKKRSQSASAQAALKLQLHGLLSSTVLLQTGTLLLCHCQMAILVYLMPFP